MGTCWRRSGGRMFEDLAGFQGLFASERTQDYNKFINAGDKFQREVRDPVQPQLSFSPGGGDCGTWTDHACSSSAYHSVSGYKTNPLIGWSYHPRMQWPDI